MNTVYKGDKDKDSNSNISSDKSVVKPSTLSKVLSQILSVLT